MIQLLTFRAAVSKIRYCRTLLVKSECKSKVSVTTRSVMTKTSTLMESRLMAQDSIPKGFHIVYRGGMNYYVHLASHSSIVLAFLGIGVIYRMFYIEDEPVQFPVKTVLAPVGVNNYTQLFIMYGVFFLMMFSMRYISSKYVLRMYYNPMTKTYRVIKVGILPTATSSHDFQAGTLQRITKKHVIPWMNCIYNANGTKIMFFGDGFKTSSDYNRLFKDC